MKCAFCNKTALYKKGKIEVCSDHKDTLKVVPVTDEYIEQILNPKAVKNYGR